MGEIIKYFSEYLSGSGTNSHCDSTLQRKDAMHLGYSLEWVGEMLIILLFENTKCYGNAKEQSK